MKKNVAISELEDYNIIISEIENMYVYNRRFKFKEKLKELIKKACE